MGESKELTMAMMLDGAICDEYDAFLVAYPEYPVNAEIYSFRYKDLSDFDILSITKLMALEVIRKGYANLLVDFIQREAIAREAELLNEKLQDDNRDSGGQGFIQFKRM